MRAFGIDLLLRSIRGDLSNKAVRFAAETALNGAVSWFDQYLKPA
jgi:hypothetical protein